MYPYLWILKTPSAHEARRHKAVRSKLNRGASSYQFNTFGSRAAISCVCLMMSYAYKHERNRQLKIGVAHTRSQMRLSLPCHTCRVPSCSEHWLRLKHQTNAKLGLVTAVYFPWAIFDKQSIVLSSGDRTNDNIQRALYVVKLNNVTDLAKQ